MEELVFLDVSVFKYSDRSIASLAHYILHLRVNGDSLHESLESIELLNSLEALSRP